MHNSHPSACAQAPSEEETLKVCRFLVECGVALAIPGMYFITPDEVVHFIKDAEDLYAELEGTKGVSEEDLEAFKLVREWRCCGKNRNGHRCAAYAHSPYGRPADWIAAGRPLPLCKKHGGR